MNAIKRFWAWLCHPEYPGVPYETVVVMRQKAYELGLELGRAQGELRGRLQLAHEIAVIHAVDGGNQDLGLEQAKLIKARQLH